MFKNIKKNKPSSPIQAKTESTLDWLPFKDIAGRFIFRCDSYLVAAIQIEPMNITLKSDNEKHRIISSIHEALNGQRSHIQIIVLPRPVDLDKYLGQLQDAAREMADIGRKKILQSYIQYVTTVVRGGEALERRYYILLAQEPEIQGKDELIQRAYELATNLGRSGLKLSLCEDLQILDMMFSFFYPIQAAFESAPAVSSITTIYKEGRMNHE